MWFLVWVRATFQSSSEGVDVSINPTKLALGFLGPFITAGSGLLAAAVGKYGVHLDPSGINALGVAGASAGAAIVVKLIHDVETDVGKTDPGLVRAVKEGVSDTEKALQVAVKVDPQLAQAASQAEHVAETKVEAVQAEGVDALDHAWPSAPADPPTTSVVVPVA
jgi:hypothetical protein